MRDDFRESGSRLLCMVLCVIVAVDVAASFAEQGSVSPPSGRFAVVSDGAAVKDAQTGVIWEQSPDLFYGAWIEAIAHCEAKQLGGQTGWRLPSIKELSTLIDSSQKDPALPAGHPFGNIKSSIFWSSTPSETDDIVAWHASFFSGEVVTDQKSQTRRAWCMLNNEPPRR